MIKDSERLRSIGDRVRFFHVGQAVALGQQGSFYDRTDPYVTGRVVGLATRYSTGYMAVDMVEVEVEGTGDVVAVDAIGTTRIPDDWTKPEPPAPTPPQGRRLRPRYVKQRDSATMEKVHVAFAKRSADRQAEAESTAVLHDAIRATLAAGTQPAIVARELGISHTAVTKIRDRD